MSKTISQTINDLRADLVNIEGHQVELLAERDEHSYAGVVERQPAAIKKLAAINSELDNLKNQTASLEAALREATRREAAAAEGERAEKRKANASAAAEALMRAEGTAELLTKAMSDMRSHSMELQRQFAEIRGLIDAGPSDQLLRINLARSLKAAVMGSVMQLEHLAPDQRVPVDAVIGTWATSIRNRISASVGEKPAKEAA
jgi:DNA repair exonuclease SbcCD ATPase subunit